MPADNHPAAVAEAARAVEEAWEAWDKNPEKRDTLALICLMHNLDVWLAAHRAARAAGFVEVMVSREGIEALKAWKVYNDSRCPCCDDGDDAAECTCFAPDFPDPLLLLVRDLAPLLK